jgi:phage nucleotide-binding protein
MEIKSTAVTGKTGESKDLYGLTMILYGEPGIGKTHAINYLPDKTTLYIGFEGGDEPLIGKDIPIINFSAASGKDSLIALKQVMDAIIRREEIVIGKMKINTAQLTNVAIDNISELERYMQIGLMKTRGKSFMTLKEYGDSTQKMKEYMRTIRDLKLSGLYVTAIAHEQIIEERDETGSSVTRTFPQMGQRIVREIMGMFDIVGRMEREYGDSSEGIIDAQRVIRLNPNQRVAAKCRITGLTEMYGDTVSQDIGELYRNAYKLRKDRTTRPKTGENK